MTHPDCAPSQVGGAKTDRLTERAIQSALASRRSGLLIPNARPFLANGGPVWEFDLAQVVQTRRLYEYEIKLSWADFQCDFGKRLKHRVLAGARPLCEANLGEAWVLHGPARFWYACPEGIITARDVPHYAGLIWLRGGGETQFAEEVCVKAPLLHDQCVSAEQFQRLAFTFSEKTWRGALA